MRKLFQLANKKNKKDNYDYVTLTFEEFVSEMKDYDKSFKGKLNKLKYKFNLESRLNRFSYDNYHIPFSIKFFTQRAKRGWSSGDVWNLDSFLTRVMINTFTELKESKQGIPCILYDENGNEIYQTFLEETDDQFKKKVEQFDELIDTIILGLKAADIIENEWLDSTSEEYKKLKDQEIKAFKLMAYNWGVFWD